MPCRLISQVFSTNKQLSHAKLTLPLEKGPEETQMGN